MLHYLTRYLILQSVLQLYLGNASTVVNVSPVLLRCFHASAVLEGADGGLA